MTNVDTRRLLSGLEDYRDSLLLHQQELQRDHEAIQNYWNQMNAVFTGDAADEFRMQFFVTNSRFLEYSIRVQKILKMLDERISSLKEYNRREGL